MADVFISYSRKDEAFVRRLHDGLAQHKRDVWIDWRDIPPTAEWLKEIFASIEAADNWSPDGKRLATGCEDKTTKIWEAATGRELLTVVVHQRETHGARPKREGQPLPPVPSDSVSTVVWSPDGKRLATGNTSSPAKVCRDKIQMIHEPHGLLETRMQARPRSSDE